jgi:hypothetical protein
MKRLVLLLSMVSITALAQGINDSRIAKIKAEIAELDIKIEQMKKDGRDPGRGPAMERWRKVNELKKLEDMNIPLAKN